jgi:hypothetical protein
MMQRNPLHESSPRRRGPSTPRGLVLTSGALEYWIPAFAGMTAAFVEAAASTRGKDANPC